MQNSETRETTSRPGVGDGAQLELGSSPAPAVRIDPGPENILYLTFDDPDRRANVFTADVLVRLDQLLDELARASEASAVIVRSVKPDCFLAGADIEAVARIRTKAEGIAAARLGQRVFAKVETLRLPVIAAVDGACLGGGAEFALACHFRLFSDRRATRFGFPEVRLGLLPAWGGTQRLPQLVGLRRAIGLILSGRPIDGEQALRMGLADEVFPAELFADQVLAFTRRVVAAQRGPRRAEPRLGGWEKLLERTRVGRAALFARAHEDLYARTRGLYPAPPMALNAMRIGVERGRRAGYAVEARSAGDLLVSPATRNMIAVHFMKEAAAKAEGVADLAGGAPRVRDLGVIGAGVMGAGIAHAATRAEIPVRLRDVKHEAIARALADVRALYHREVEHGQMTPADVERHLGLVATTLEAKGFRRADLVIEAVTEDQDLKMQVLREIEPEVREDAIIASNTSALSITNLAAALWRPSRCIGLHFFHPVERMPLVEVVRGAQTEDWVVASAFDLVKRLGKTPLLVADRPGFLVNRLLAPYLNEACLLLEEGFTIDVVDRAMRNFGLPLGPLELLDEIGLDVALGAAERMKKAYATPFSPLLALLVARGRLGRKSGLGFYRSTGSERRVDPEVQSLVESLPAGAGPPVAPGSELAANLQERLMLPMINEAARCLEEGVVATPAAVDLGLVLGIGFPSFRGGILRHADALDVKTVVERMELFAAEGRSRYEPAPLLVQMARAGRTFFPDA